MVSLTVPDVTRSVLTEMQASPVQEQLRHLQAIRQMRQIPETVTATRAVADQATAMTAMTAMTAVTAMTAAHTTRSAIDGRLALAAQHAAPLRTIDPLAVVSLVAAALEAERRRVAAAAPLCSHPMFGPPCGRALV